MILLSFWKRLQNYVNSKLALLNRWSLVDYWPDVILWGPNLHEMTGGGCPRTTHGSRTLAPRTVDTRPGISSNSMSPNGRQLHTTSNLYWLHNGTDILVLSHIAAAFQHAIINWAVSARDVWKLQMNFQSISWNVLSKTIIRYRLTNRQLSTTTCVIVDDLE